VGGDRLDRGQDRLHAETLRLWVRQAERVAGRRSCPTSAESERVKVLECENRELRQAN
jgi:transposase